MMSVQKWEHFFKPEIRASGLGLLRQSLLSVSRPSDTEIVVYVRRSPPLKVSLKTPSMASPLVVVDCGCAASKKNQFCKHIWASLLAAQEKNSDFFDSKTEIKKKKFVTTAKTPQSDEKSKAFEAKQAALKEKQATYRKEQYQKQKQRQKDYKNLKNKSRTDEPRFPMAVESALEFFSKNGFEIKSSFDKESISFAKKKLARIFHPDLGGSHEETSELNHQADVLMKFIGR